MKPSKVKAISRTTSVLFLVAFCEKALAAWTGEPIQTNVKMLLYRSSLEEAAAPTATDQKLWIQMEGNAAKEVFKHLKSTRYVQSEANGVVVERKSAHGLQCKTGPQTRDYQCVFQMDLVTGEVIEGPFSESPRPASWHSQVKSAKASYIIYKGVLADMTVPKIGQSKLALYIEGNPAGLLFNAIGPDQKEECMPEDDPFRSRSRVGQAVVCMRYIKSKNSSCAIGLDLKKIKPIPATTC